MSLIIPLSSAEALNPHMVGGKCAALARIDQMGLQVPKTFCLTTQAYDQFVDDAQLRERIAMELSRKDFADMRWEEIWDAALRIRNLFLRASIPETIACEVQQLLGELPSGRFALRSSSTAEDGRRASFAGLHESFMNVCGLDETLKHIKLVWASLWSDAALLYRQELALSPFSSKMAVVLQNLVPGGRSGIAFTRSPNSAGEAVIEAVYGLNQGLVDGDIEPDRWYVARGTADIQRHEAPARNRCLTSSPDGGVDFRELSPTEIGSPPISESEVDEVFCAAMSLERNSGCPQDVEWTYKDALLIVLQARPITTVADEDSKRLWYLSLSRGMDNLKQLRSKVEDEILPEMERVASELSVTMPEQLGDEELQKEAARRSSIYQHWRDVYWDDCIPLAHGVRLFGQVYNDMLEPEDPYEFTKLLAGADISGIRRNEMISEIAAYLRDNPQQRELIRVGEEAKADTYITERLSEYRERFGAPGAVFSNDANTGTDPVLALLLLLSRESAPTLNERKTFDLRTRESEFVRAFPQDRRAEAEELLELGRASYRLRDDDNIYLERIAAEEKRFRIELESRRKSAVVMNEEDDGDIGGAMLPPDQKDTPSVVLPETVMARSIEARQLKGQPAAQGICTGPARVIESPNDLAFFQPGEILVCDAIDPNMTFVVPLALGVVERRGGMLIHGAIIAREYGLPCITGIPDATGWIKTGDRITVDGYLGIVTLLEREVRQGAL